MDDLRSRLTSLTPGQRARFSALLNRAAAPEGGIPRRSGAGPAPLSFAQERLWFISQLEPDRTGYNVPRAVEIEGPLDYAALERSINAVIERHEILRTTYGSRDGVPFQQIAPERRLRLDVRDLRGRPRDEIDRALAEVVARPFDLAVDLVIRAHLLRVQDARHILLLNIHHIACDGWSMSILNAEISAFYSGFLAGAQPRLAPLPIQYADFAEWQREQLSGEALEAQVAYWKARLAGAAPLDLGERSMASPNATGGYVPIEIAAELTAAIRRLCLEEGVTLFMAVLAAFQTLLSRCTGQSDISVGMPMGNRDVTDTEDLIGFFVNTLVMRGDLSGERSFRAHLAKVRDAALDAYSHHDLPFEKLVEVLQPERSLTRSPLFQAMLGVQPAAANLKLAGANVEHLRIPLHAAKFDLMISLDDHGDSLRGGLTFNRDVVSPLLAARLADGLTTLLDAVSRDPGIALAKVPLLSAADRQLALVDWNATTAPQSNLLLVEEFERIAAASPDRIAVTCAAGPLSYAELNARADAIARELRRRGFGRDRLAGIFLDRSADQIAAVLGVHKAGGAYLPLDPAHPDARLRFVLEDSGAALVITGADLTPRLRPADVSVLEVEALTDREGEYATEGLDARPDQLAYVLYTSGSTGTPKGVGVSQAALANAIRAIRAETGFHAGDVMPALATLAFDIAGVEIFAPLTTGGRVVLVPRSVAADGEALAGLLAREGATIVQATPATWQMLVDAGWRGGPALRVLSGGETLARPLAEALLDRAAAVWNCYGPTETTIYSTVHRVRRATGPVPVGRPILNTRVYILDPRLEPAVVGGRGELCIGGAGVACGYLRRPELTADRFVADPFSTDAGALLYRTGDLARWREDGELEFLGRLDDQVKIRGRRVEPGEIEAALLELAGVRQAAVVAREAAGGAVLDAYVTIEPGCGLAAAEMRTALKRRLPDYMVPAAIRLLDALPSGPSGKIDRHALAANAAAGESSAPAGATPQTPLEVLVAEIWSELLGVGGISVDANFFALGGHSLMAARVVSRLRKALGITVPVRLMFESPTVAELAVALASLQAESLGEAELLKLLEEIEGAGEQGRAAGGSRA